MLVLTDIPRSFELYVFIVFIHCSIQVVVEPPTELYIFIIYHILYLIFVSLFIVVTKVGTSTISVFKSYV